MQPYPYDPTQGPGGPPPVAVAAPVGVTDPYTAYAAAQAAQAAQAVQAYAAPPPATFVQPPPAAFYYQPQPVQLPVNPDEVRTIFVTGFPEDVKERELNNMLRFLPGYEASQMHFRNGQAQGFALFAHGASARAAVDAVHNLVFDDGVVLRAEMAHKNMYIKDDAGSKRSRPTTGTGGPSGGGGGGYPGAPGGFPGGPGGPPGAAGGPGGAAPSSFQYATSMPTSAVVPATQPRGYAQVTNTKDNPPCNTLFVGNLGDTVNEAELRGLFCHQPGFRQLKLVRGPRGVSCFIEFADVSSAMAVHATQQGAILTSSDRGGIRIQYSKNPFGRKRDAYGNYVAEGHEQNSAGAPAMAGQAAQAAQSVVGGIQQMPPGVQPLDTAPPQ